MGNCKSKLPPSLMVECQHGPVVERLSYDYWLKHSLEFGTQIFYEENLIGTAVLTALSVEIDLFEKSHQNVLLKILRSEFELATFHLSR